MLRGESTIRPIILSQRLDIRFPNRISKGILHEPGFFIAFSVYFEFVVGSRSFGRIGGLATHYSVVWTTGLWMGKTLWTPTGRCIGCNARNIHGSVATACPIRFGKNGGQLSRMASHGLSEQGYVSENHERQQVILRAIETIRGSFERTTWQAFWRTSVDGVDPQAVADELGMSRWAVYKCRSRVLHRLRTELLGLERLA
jgi:hypothetical protein